jgi:hypothetical protein
MGYTSTCQESGIREYGGSLKLTIIRKEHRIMNEDTGRTNTTALNGPR